MSQHHAGAPSELGEIFDVAEGYRKTAPLVAATHIAIGLGTILASLFTDYRSYRGVGRARATGSR